MILQLANIISGFILAAPLLATWGGRAFIDKALHALAPLTSAIGVVELVLGIIGLLERAGLLRFYIPHLGASYPQTIPAILVGLILCAPYFIKTSGINAIIEKMKPYREWIGVMAIVSGLNSILFGCWLCMYY